MTAVGGVVTCVAGGMSLSPALQETLAGRFPDPRPGPGTAGAGRGPSRWHCPGCGLPLGPAMDCPGCGRSIRDQLFRLVELHPHARP